MLRWRCREVIILSRKHGNEWADDIETSRLEDNDSDDDDDEDAVAGVVYS